MTQARHGVPFHGQFELLRARDGKQKKRVKIEIFQLGIRRRPSSFLEQGILGGVTNMLWFLALGNDEEDGLQRLPLRSSRGRN